MKSIMIFIIRIYQKIPGPWHNKFKFYPTCSNYAIDALNEYGFFKGTILSFKRIVRCNPFNEGGYDPVIKKGEVYEKNN